VDTAFTIVVNPAAGGGKAYQCLQAVQTVLDAAGVRYLTHDSKSLIDAGSLATEGALRGDHVVAVGGDGMAGAIASAVARAKPAGDGLFAIIPAGRGNDLARTYGIPFGSNDAAKLLLAGQLRPMDLIEVTGADGTQASAAGSLYVGIASMAGEIANEFRFIRGPIAYPAAALRALVGWRPAVFTIGSAGSTPVAGAIRTPDEFQGYGIVITSIPYFGAGMKVAPNAAPGDGMLEVVLMRHAPKLVFLRVLRMVGKGTHVKLPQISTGRATNLEVNCNRSMPVGVDGESLHISFPLRIRVIPNALKIMAPAMGDPDSRRP
jgi:diacylglycerol kinase (ATP)